MPAANARTVCRPEGPMRDPITITTDIIIIGVIVGPIIGIIA